MPLARYPVYTYNGLTLHDLYTCTHESRVYESCARDIPIVSDVSIYKSHFDIDFDYFHVTKFDFDFFRYSHVLLLNVVVII
jgi:hypothetical protein